MTEPTTVPVEAPVPAPWTAAVAAVMHPFVIYALERQISSDLDECRQQARVSAATAALFEEALDAISEDQEDDEDHEDDATPGRQGPGAADNQAPTQ